MNVDFSLNTEMIILAHLAINFGTFIICFHRLRLMQKVLFRVKAQYVILLVASVANGFSPILFRQWPTLVSIFYASAVFYVLWSDKFQWKHGPPDAARSDYHPPEAAHVEPF